MIFCSCFLKVKEMREKIETKGERKREREDHLSERLKLYIVVKNTKPLFWGKCSKKVNFRKC